MWKGEQIILSVSRRQSEKQWVEGYQEANFSSSSLGKNLPIVTLAPLGGRLPRGSKLEVEEQRLG